MRDVNKLIHAVRYVVGNMWSQSWGNIEQYVRPAPDKPGLDVTEEMIRQVTIYLRLLLWFYCSLENKSKILYIAKVLAKTLF